MKVINTLRNIFGFKKKANRLEIEQPEWEHWDFESIDSFDLINQYREIHHKPKFEPSGMLTRLAKAKLKFINDTGLIKDGLGTIVTILKDRNHKEIRGWTVIEGTSPEIYIMHWMHNVKRNQLLLSDSTWFGMAVCTGENGEKIIIILTCK